MSLYFPSSQHTGTRLAIPRYGSFCGCLLTSIFWGEFMAAFAMSFSLLSRSICRTTESKTRKIYVFVLGKYLSCGPTKLKSSNNCISVNTSFFSPLLGRLCAALVCNTDVYFSVICLFFARGPLTVIWTVWAIIIKSIYCVFLWTRPHVGLKRKKIIPLLADLNSSTAVSGIVSSSRCVAPGSHLKPDAVNRSFALPVFYCHSQNILYWKGQVNV